jgi:hypothetical protein
MDMMQQYEGAPPYPAGPVVEKTWKPLVGGILIILGALAGVIAGIWLAAIGGALDAMMPIEFPGVTDALTDIITICGVIWLIFGIIGLLGGIFAIKRTHYGLAILGGIFALLAGFFILGLIGLILVAISKNEFS